MKPPMQVGCRKRPPGRFSGFYITAVPLRIVHRQRLPHANDEGISGRVDGLAFDLSLRCERTALMTLRAALSARPRERRAENFRQLHESARFHDSHEKKSLQEDQQ
jgi:hypothetical protein